MMDDCQRVYTENWLKTRQNVLSCKPRRFKRQLAALMGSSIVREIATAGTNFLVNKFVKSQMERKQMLDMMSYGTDYDQLFRRDMSKFMSLSSPAASRHQQETDNQGRAYPKGVWITAALTSEILANAANLDMIAHWCRLGKLATYELGELVGDERLQKLDPDRTEVRSVVEGDHSESITFNYVVHPEYKELKPLPPSSTTTTTTPPSPTTTPAPQRFENPHHLWYILSFATLVLILYAAVFTYFTCRSYKKFIVTPSPVALDNASEFHYVPQPPEAPAAPCQPIAIEGNNVTNALNETKSAITHTKMITDAGSIFERQNSFEQSKVTLLPRESRQI